MEGEREGKGNRESRAGREGYLFDVEGGGRLGRE